ncbi:zinc-dependent peptidase [Flavobacterium tegetincola]|uniref:zinc-dependent peptidase n=1 Tax=Flavobacterium tegetincola TaxID=150172 RepID=UPI0005538E3F|nr:zinc-dependent peptidase [Flavobacterium tegetincola]
MYLLLIFILILGLGFYSYNWKLKSKKNWSPPKELFPTKWRIILNEEIPFYRTLNDTEKEKFEFKVQEFLLNCSIIGVGTEITIVDKVLVASSAIIPIFGFENWQYHDLHEVLIYPGIFNKEFETEGPNRTVLGMVGTGYMDGKMILSQEALTHGFENKTDKKNTAIHEFAHLIDKRDGVIDGIPHSLLDDNYLEPWINYMDKKLDEVFDGDSDINPYGGTNRAEFFSVTSEYFFERPKLLKKKHPELYELLEKIYKQDLSKRDLKKPHTDLTDKCPCPCDSGKKYKDCCGNFDPIG